MKKLIFAALILGFAATAFAETVTDAQQAEARKELTYAEFHKMLEAERAATDLHKILEAERAATDLQPEDCAVAEVNYDLTPTEVAEGYDWYSPPFKDGGFNASPRGKGKVAKGGCWFKFDPKVSSEEAQNRIEASGKFLVADLWELNAFGTGKTDLQRKFSIIGLGSQWRSPGGYVGFPVLSRHAGGRGLDLFMAGLGGRWASSCRFLAVRKWPLAS